MAFAMGGAGGCTRCLVGGVGVRQACWAYSDFGAGWVVDAVIMFAAEGAVFGDDVVVRVFVLFAEN